MPTFWGMRGRVRPSSHRGRQRRRGGDAVCVEPPFGGGPRRQVRGQLTHPCCHGEFAPRHRETAAFPQNLMGSVRMSGFSRQWGRTSKCWGVLARCRGAREQHVPSWKVKKMPLWAAVIVLPLPRLGRSQLLPLAVLLLGDHRAGISLGQTWEDMAERKLSFPGENNLPWGCVPGSVTPLGPSASPQDPGPDGCQHPMGANPWCVAGLDPAQGHGAVCGSRGYKAVSGWGVLTPPSGSPGPGSLPLLGPRAWGGAGGFPLLLKNGSKNSTGFWHGCRNRLQG